MGDSISEMSTSGRGNLRDTWLSTEDLCRYFTRGDYQIKAVDSVSLGVAQGEFVGVVGSSGSGKSTLLNLLAGLDTPTSGTIRFAGMSLNDLDRKELATYRGHRMGIVFQSFNLLPHLTAEQNVSIGMAFNDTPRAERKMLARDILGRLGLEDRLDHRPADLSGGEQQRVALARALARRPEVLFADEPTGNLDKENTTQIAELLKELNADGLTIVMVSHDLELVRQCAARVVRMRYGRLEESAA